MLTTIFPPLVYHPFINNAEGTTAFMVPWEKYLGTFTGTISDLEEEVEKAVKKLTSTDRKPSRNFSHEIPIRRLKTGIE